MPARARRSAARRRKGADMPEETIEAAQDAQEPPAVDWQAKYEQAVAQSRKWEERSKANADKAKAYDALVQQQADAQALAVTAESIEQIKDPPARILDAGERQKYAAICRVSLSCCVWSCWAAPGDAFTRPLRRGDPTANCCSLCGTSIWRASAHR